MKVVYSRPAIEDLKKLPSAIQKRARKQVRLLAQDLRHPSIRAKKYNETSDLWQGRITKSYRFYFSIIDDGYFIHSFREHPK